MNEKFVQIRRAGIGAKILSLLRKKQLITIFLLIISTTLVLRIEDTYGE